MIINVTINIITIIYISKKLAGSLCLEYKEIQRKREVTDINESVNRQFKIFCGI